jgi:serine/threonine protein kinase/tetratricopeptide (TPR) repeat protein
LDQQSIISPGTRFGRYEVRTQIGKGGMGEVYLADDTRLGRKVAIKFLSIELTRDKNRVRRFEQEARAASALNHPNIITIHEMGDEEGRHFIATEYIDGITLRRRIAREPMDLGEVLDIALQITSALQEAHAARIVHRDIKPENIMIRRNGFVKVLDFGLAKLTEAAPAATETNSGAPTLAWVDTDPGLVIGTSQYMSPEQARGKIVDARTDIWSLGIVLYEMVAGRAPFEGETKTDVIVAIAKNDPLPLARFSQSVPQEFEWIVMKALRKNVDERYQSVKELDSDLRKLKQRLEFQTELERSVANETLASSLGASGLSVSGPGTSSVWQSLPQTNASSGARSTASAAPGSDNIRASSLEYLVNGAKRHKARSVLAGIAIIGLLVATLARGMGYWPFVKQPAGLTEKDTILLADFVNTTGEVVLDDTLKQALAVQLSQSPFLNILPEDRLHEALRFMGRSPDERVTRDIAREICERQGIKAMLLGSVARLGSHYVVSLEALNSRTGATIASEQIEAESKEQILKALGQGASRLREKLGESLSSIQKFDAPIEQATTSSLDALRAYSLGAEQHSSAKYFEAIPLYKRAIELDPNFAIAYARLALAYNNTRQFELSREASQKAYELRDRVSERERFFVTWSYYGGVTGEWEKTDEVLELWHRTYPQDWVPLNSLALRHTVVGLFERAAEEANEAIRLNPNSALPRSNLGYAFIGLNRFDEAKSVFQQSLAQNLETTNIHSGLFYVAAMGSDANGMKQQIDWATGRPDEYLGQNWQAQVAEFSGQLTKADEFSEQAIALAQRRELKEIIGQTLLTRAMRHATLGRCQQVSELTNRALDTSRDRSSLITAATALALCKQAGPAQALADELSKKFATDSLMNAVSLSLIRAQLEMSRGNAPKALQFLETARQYDVAGSFWPQYLRGQAYLSQRNGAQAAAQFKTILDHRGWYPLSPLYPLAQLGLARAAVIEGDNAKARQAYQDFFVTWKEADPDIQLLVEARREYAELK